MAKNDETKITFEAIYEILRAEKKNEELTKLGPSFLADATAYLKDRQSSALPDDELTQKQISNVKRMLTEIVERRETKIIKLAMHAARLLTSFADKSKLTDVELALFSDLNTRMRGYRATVLESMLKGTFSVPKNPVAQEHKTPQAKTLQAQPQAEEETKQAKTSKKEPLLETAPSEPAGEPQAQQTQDLKTSTQPPAADDPLRSVTFTANVSKFVGENMEIFGPYTKDEQAKLPRKIADILIARQQAL